MTVTTNNLLAAMDILEPEIISTADEVKSLRKLAESKIAQAESGNQLDTQLKNYVIPSLNALEASLENVASVLAALLGESGLPNETDVPMRSPGVGGPTTTETGDATLERPTSDAFYGIVNDRLMSWPKMSDLAGNPANKWGSQYKTIDNMSAQGRQISVRQGENQITFSLEVNQDVNSCGPLSIGVIVNHFGAGLTAQQVFQKHVKVNGHADGFKPRHTTTVNQLARIASVYHVYPDYNDKNIRAEGHARNFVFKGSDLETEILQNLKNNRPMLALINITDNGIIWDDTDGINHWVVVDGVAFDSTRVRFWNPFWNRHETADGKVFYGSFVGGQNTLIPFEHRPGG